MGLNTELINDRFQDIAQAFQRLDRIKKLPRDQFLADRDVLDITCFRLLVAIEAALQICFHVCAQHLERAPREYAECFAILGEAGVLSEELSQRLQRMARFRNMLVHVYWEIDYNRVYDILANLDDLRAFVQAIEALL